jgi:deazaflavin-dependent oxidoreductase (nitroreductase family)
MPFPRFMTIGHRSLNQIALRGAGRRAVVDLEHVGRRSGTVRHTPLRGFRVGDEVVVGLNFGRESDWFKNIRAAGHCRMRIGHEWVELGPPRLVSARDGTSGMPRWFGWGLRYVVRTKDIVVLPVLSSMPATEEGTLRG